MTAFDRISRRADFELLVAFDRIDTSDDRRMDAAEFESAMPLLAAWGVTVADPAAAFAAIDTDGSGRVVFDEFCGWALASGLDMDPTDNVADEGSLAGRHTDARARAAQAARETAERRKESQRARAIEIGDGDGTSGIDLRRVVGKLPVRDTSEDEGRRSALFASCDTNRNGELALTELLQGLCLHFGVLGALSARAFAPAIKRAFSEAQQPGSAKVGRREFRSLLVCLKLYLELLVAFDQIDTSDDRRIDRAEFERALPLFAEWNVPIENPEAEYAAINSAGGGKVLFGEFATWALRRGLDVWKGRELAGRGGAELARQLEAAGEGRRGAQTKRRPPKPLPTTADLLGLGPTTRLTGLIARLPCGLEPAHQQARAQIFAACDTRGDGMLGPADVDAGLRALIEAVSGRRVLDPEPPGIAHAFHSTLLGKGRTWVDPSCFRFLLCHLKWYATWAAASPRGRVPAPLANPHAPQRAVAPARGRAAARLPPLASGAPRRLGDVGDSIRWPAR